MLTVEIATPGHAPRRFEAAEVVLPGESGVFTVLPGHTPLLASLTHGVLISYALDGGARFFAIHRGFAEVRDDLVTVMAMTIEDAAAIDAERAAAARERAEGRLKKPAADIDTARAEAALARAAARLQAHGGEEYH